MSGQAVRYVGAALAGVAALALVVAAIVLATRDNETAPIRIIAPESTQVSEPPADIKVQVSGEVTFPGVYRMKPDDRVMDAVVAAGGITPNADITGINLSRRVQDEAHYHVPAIGSATRPQPTLSPNGEQLGDGPIDLNTATVRELEILPGIGPTLATAIVSYRSDNGPFGTVADLEGVPGIGPKTLEAVRRLVSVSNRP